MQTTSTQTESTKTERELEALQNAVDYYKLKGYKVCKVFSSDKRATVGKYFLRNDKGFSITGAWEYDKINHFIMGYGKAFADFKQKYL